MIVYPWRLIKFIYATVFYTNFNKEEMLQKHIEIYWKCLVKVVSDRTCRRWYEKFETGDFDLSDKPCSGRPSLIDTDVGARSFSDNIGDRRKTYFSSTNHFWPYLEDRIGVEIFKIGTWIKSEKFGWSSYYMHISACSEQNRALFEPDDNWGWKVDYIQQHCKENGILWIRKT